MTSKAEDVLKIFGMTNQLLEADLARIEAQYNIDLGREQGAEVLEEDYYSQFDEAIRTEASSMSKHYQLFYCLEKSIRLLITESLKEAEGANWWDSGRIPQRIHDDCAERIRRERDSGVTIRSEHAIDYSTFGELSQIIVGTWDIFGSLFNSQRALERVMGNLNILRGPIAHCAPLAEDEIIRLELSLRDWFRLME